MIIAPAIATPETFPLLGDATNAFTEQAKAIRDAINLAEDGSELNAASQLLAFAAPLWAAMGWAYKAKELRQAIAHKASQLIRDNQDLLDASRKNWRGAGFARNDISVLQQIREINN